MQLVLIRLSQSFLVLLLALFIQLRCDFECLTSLVAPLMPATTAPPCHHQADSEQPAHHQSNPEKQCDRHATGDQVVVTAKAASPAPAVVAIDVTSPAVHLMSDRYFVLEHPASESTNSSRIVLPLRI
jgi:hypothetical protein